MLYSFLYKQFLKFKNFTKFHSENNINLNKMFSTNELQNWGVDFLNKSSNCVVICNGPSLNKSLQEYKNLITSSVKVVVNFFPLTDLFYDLKPEVLIQVDPNFFKTEGVPEFLINQRQLLKDKLKKVNWDLKFIIPADFRNNNSYDEICHLNENIEIIYINLTLSDEINHLTRFKEYMINRSAPLFQSVSIAAIYFGINVGFKNIYLFGCDHDWIKNMIVDDNNNLLHKDTHFHDENFQQYRIIESNLLEEYKAMYMLHKSYYELNEYAQFLKVKIFNCSSDSMIDCFDRKVIL